MENTYVVIMAGGTGTRFWPYSRQQKPKQFLDILGVGKSLLQLTYDRFSSLVPADRIFIVSQYKYKDLLDEQMPHVSSEQILLEPSKKNTAPCIAYAYAKIASRNPDAKLVITPADHAIFDTAKYYDVIKQGVSQTDDEKIITIGITPTRPDTGFGYIQYKESDTLLKKVKTFTEKPDEPLAEKFIESGDYVWNAGIFIANAKALNTAFSEHLPETQEAFEDIKDKFYTDEEQAAIHIAYEQCRNISIDYGIMEKSEHVYALLGDFQWIDLGSWNSLRESMESDEDNNLIRANVQLNDVNNTVILSDKDDKLIVVEGLEGYVVADCGNALLICKKSSESQMRRLVEDVKKNKGETYL